MVDWCFGVCPVIDRWRANAGTVSIVAPPAFFKAVRPNQENAEDHEQQEDDAAA